MDAFEQKAYDKYMKATPTPTPNTSTIVNEHNVCGKGYYVLNPIARNIHKKNHPLGCNVCPNPLPTNQKNLEDLNLPSPYPVLNDLQEMCNTDTKRWFPKQYDMDVTGKVSAVDRVNWGSIVTGDTVTNSDLYKKWYEDRLTNNDINYFYKDAKYDGSLDEFKKEISDTRGSIVPCKETPDTRLNINVPPGFKCSKKGTFGPDHIILDEYEDWRKTHITKPLEIDKLPNFQNLFQDVGPPNRNFEDCINNIFRGNNEIDLSMTEEIKAVNHFRDFEERHIIHIKQKLQAFLINSNKEQLIDCINKHLYLDTSICKAGLHDKMIKIISIILYVVGYNLKLNDIQFDSDRDKLIYIIDELGDLIPRVLETIIHLSETYEVQNCGGIRDSTRILKELHSTVFKRGENVINFDMGLSKLTSPSLTSDTEFQRTSILGVLAIAFLKYF